MIPLALLLGIVRHTLAANSFDKNELLLKTRDATALSFPHIFHASSAFSISSYKAESFAPASPNIVTSNVIPLITQRGNSLSKLYLGAYHSQQSKRSLSGESPVLWAVEGNVYLTPIKFGSQSFFSVLDTGSADTWLVSQNFSCLEVPSRRPLAQKKCGFGPSFNTSASSTFKVIPDQYFNISYGDGEFLNGVMGTEDITLAGITIPKQTVGVVDYAAWQGDFRSSGLIGLAYPSVTRAYPGNNTRTDRQGSHIPYNPLFTTMWKSNLTAPLFSLALARNKNEDGVLAFGGLPGHPVKYSTKFARTPIEYTTITSTMVINGTSTQVNRTEYRLYSIKVETFSFARQTSRSQGSATPEKILTQKSEGTLLIDSGTTLMYLSTALASSINAVFTPAARYDTKTRIYFVECNATAPRVGLTIAGTTFWVDPKDMIVSDKSGSTCISGVQSGGEGLMILGDVWLKSVLAVFDVGAGEMRFAVRY